MLDKLNSAVLNVINTISDGTFKVVDADEIIEKLNLEEKPTKLKLSGAIKNLAERDLIKVKSASLDMYCLASTPKARITEEITVAPVAEQVPVAGGKAPIAKVPTKGIAPSVDFKLLRRAIYRAALFGSIFGGAIGGAIVAVITHLIG